MGRGARGCVRWTRASAGSADAAEEVVQSIKSAGQKPVALQLDVADAASFSVFAERLRGGGSHGSRGSAR